MPIADWQFWVVSLVALIAAWVVLRPIVAPLLRRRPHVPRRKTALTIEGTAPERHRGVASKR